MIGGQELFRREVAIALVAVGLFVGFAVGSPHFLDPQTQLEILRVTGFTLLVALPLTLLVIAGEVDLSIGSNIGLASVVTALAMVDWGWNPWCAGLVAVALGGAIGLFNGWAVVGLGIPSFILTIGMLSLLRGVALVVTMGLSIDIPSDVQSSFFAVAGGSWGPIPAQVIWALVATALVGFVLRHTLFGAHLYATGGNLQAATRLGLRPERIKIAVFTAMGLCCGLVGALTTGWLRLGAPNTGTGGELATIAAVIIGGAALSGGVGTASGTVIGALIVSMLQIGLVLVGVQGNWVQVCVGGLIVAAASLEPVLRANGRLAEWLQPRTVATAGAET